MKIKSGFPVLYLIWIIASVAFFCFFLNIATLVHSIITSIVISCILYLCFIRKYCLLSLDGSSLKIKYLFPLTEIVQINLEDIAYVEFELNYFYLLEEDTKVRSHYLFYPYDTMIIHFKKNLETRRIDFNSPILSTTKIYRFLKKKFANP